MIEDLYTITKKDGKSGVVVNEKYVMPSPGWPPSMYPFAPRMFFRISIKNFFELKEEDYPKELKFFFKDVKNFNLHGYYFESLIDSFDLSIDDKGVRIECQIRHLETKEFYGVESNLLDPIVKDRSKIRPNLSAGGLPSLRVKYLPKDISTIGAVVSEFIHEIESLIIESRNVYNQNVRYQSSKIATIPIKNEIKVHLKQYLEFFQFYILTEKDIDISINLTSVDGGIQMIVAGADKIENNLLSTWLQDYIQLLSGSSREKYFEQKVYDDSYINLLELQVQHFRNSLQIALHLGNSTFSLSESKLLLDETINRDLIIQNLTIIGGKQQFADKIINNTSNED